MLFGYTLKQARIDFPYKFFAHQLIPETQRKLDDILPYYDDVYSDHIQADNSVAALETLFTIFNVDHPIGFKGHSLSVSDIVLLKYDAHEELWYCNPIGWQCIGIKN